MAVAASTGRPRPERHLEVLVVGAGVAGLATAFHLTRLGVRGVLVVEREAMPAAHASGRNAGIFRQVEADPLLAALARRSREQLAALPGEVPLLRATGALFVAGAGGAHRLAALAEGSRQAGLDLEATSAAEAGRRCGLVEPSLIAGGLYAAEDGVVDVHGLAQACLAGARAAGARLRTGCGVERVVAREGRVAGVVTAEGEWLPARAVVNAAGAWAGPLGEAAGGSALPLGPRRRHLVQLEPAAPADPAGPVVWHVGAPAYFRPESGGILASPCDEEAAEPGTPAVEPAAVEALGHRLGQFAPRLAQARVKRAWACLRTLTPDDRPVVGEDPRLPGLFWVAGLGGHGMSLGLEAGRLAAEWVVGRRPAGGEALLPARFAGRGAGGPDPAP